MTSHDYKMHLYNNFKICEQTYLLRTYENREVLENLKTDSNKNLARSHFSTYVLTLPTSEELQTLIKYFKTFFYLLVLFPFISSETTRVLSLQTECTNYLKNCQRT